MSKLPDYDAIVVGAGASGGWAAKTLAEAGMSVLVLEAGCSLRRARARETFQRLRRRTGYVIEKDARALARQSIQARCYAWSRNPHVFVDDLDQPYTTPDEKPFYWIRVHQVGGRAAVRPHGRHFYRFSELDLRAASRDGFGVDWPISSADLGPYYDRVERFMGLVGNADHLEQLPDPAVPSRVALTPAEEFFQSAIARHWPDRRLVVRRSAPPPLPIEAARATGRLALRTGVRAREVLVDPRTGRARGVSWLECGKERDASASVVVLAASAIESTRLMLNSRSPCHPDGLGNSSGTLGRYLMDHFRITFLATMPLRRDRLGWREGGSYIPRFRNVNGHHEGFLRGYGIQVHTVGDQIQLVVFGEMLPRATNRVTIDPERTDRWGIPVVRIECAYSENELALAEDAKTQCRAMLEAAGFQLQPSELRLTSPGLAVHECGTARMGDDPRTSVLDPYNRCWDARNLFVVDGACFVSQGAQNPTLTMMALALRASEHIVDLSRRHEL